MKIAIIGGGIAGNVVAHHLHPRHDITLYVADSHAGGHTHTHDIEQDGERHAIDTGFIVFNDWTYPNFMALLERLGVASQASDMSFSVRDAGRDFEYNGTSLNGLFAQRRNVLSFSFHRMLRDILRFNREAPALLGEDGEVTLGDYLREKRYSPAFIEDYLVPMGAAIWSTEPARMLDFPAQFFVRFLCNHGMLSVNDRPQWRVVRGGSARYVERLVAPFRDRIRLSAPVRRVERVAGRVRVEAPGSEPEHYDQVFFACHSDQALAMLADVTPLERELLGAIPYQRNEAVLHTDIKLLPRARRAWAAWNYHQPHASRGEPRMGVTLTYNMNILQGLDARETYCVSLNSTAAIDPARVIKRIAYDHPLFTPRGVAAQRRHAEINGPQHSYFCGAYWGWGFHEDGVVSALDALAHFAARHPGALAAPMKLPLPRARATSALREQA